MNIYIDMDEVVADWLSAAIQTVGPWDPALKRCPPEQWAQLRNHKRIYRELPVRPGGPELVSWILNYQAKHNDVFVAFLTAVPNGNDVAWAFQDKVHWANFYFPGVPVFFGPYSVDKQHHCQPGDILIDDRTSNCEEWRSRGGLAHQYKTWELCKPWLEDTLK
jgi:5'(3')-deoxyribonucleotidase